MIGAASRVQFFANAHYYRCTRSLSCTQAPVSFGPIIQPAFALTVIRNGHPSRLFSGGWNVTLRRVQPNQLPDET
jgi:hypothetical protein